MAAGCQREGGRGVSGESVVVRYSGLDKDPAVEQPRVKTSAVTVVDPATPYAIQNFTVG
jgi:hypothetical protein